MNKENLLIIFTRNPELGKVKTRLAKDVGEKAALEIYKFLLKHTVSITLNLPVDKAVYYSEGIPEQDIWNAEGFQKKLQQGRDLGEKMLNAFEEGFRSGYKRIIIIGSDLYDLTSKDLESAFAKLNGSDYVIGPAEDGGYYLLGMKRLTPKLFQNKTWSTATVFRDTLKVLEGEEVAILPERNDVDVYEDIRHHPNFQQFLEHMT